MKENTTGFKCAVSELLEASREAGEKEEWARGSIVALKYYEHPNKINSLLLYSTAS